mgnify:CR=1 FL=1
MPLVQKSSKSIPELASLGMDYPVGASKPGVGIVPFKVTLSGALHVVSLSALGLQPMADTSYCVQVEGETVSRLTVDESTITVNGFSIIGGLAAEVAHVVLVGRIEGMRDANGNI